MILDIFRGDMFSTANLTAAILKAPYKPGRIGSLGLFREKGITTLTAIVEEKAGQLSLIATSPRGGPGSQLGASKRTGRPFAAVHLERESTIMADEIQGVRAFGSESEQQAIQPIIDERLATLRAMHEVTLEYHRVGAIKGQVLDADGSTVIRDLFTDFGIAQQTYNLDMTAEVRRQAVEIQRLSEDELGATPVSGYRAFCGDQFFDALISSASVKESLKYQEGALLRGDLRQGFVYGGITWENYRGRVGGIDFFETDESFVVPDAPGVFETYFAPADFIETVNTVGLPIYAKVALDAEFNRWAKLHSQSNPLALCLRPRAVIRVTMSS